MRYGIFSDVHSNLEALEVVLKAIEEEKVDQFLCAGDLVGYGAEPAACLTLLREKAVQSVCGNHDVAVTGRMDLDWFNEAARAAVEWTSKQISQTDRSYLNDLKLVWNNSDLALVHGCLYEPEQFHYVITPADAQPSFHLQKTPVAFIGHTHTPGIFIQEGMNLSFQRVPELHLDSRCRYLVNVGSVGQPRDGDPRAAWCLYDTQKQTLQIRRVSYPVEQAQAKIRKTGLPGFLADRLMVGY